MKSILLIPRLAMFLELMKFYGLKEIRGERNNPQILQFFAEIGHKWVQTDETAWCSATINYIAKVCACQRSGKLDARSWIAVGQETNYPELGDVVVFWRESLKASWKGHVGLFVKKDGNDIYTLGGNQGDMVSIRPYPEISRDMGLIGYRKLEYV